MKQNRIAPTLVLWLFPLVAVALLVAVVVGVLEVGRHFWSGSASGLMFRWIAVPLAVAIVAGAVASLRFRPEPAESVELSPVEHPELWRHVTELAANAQTESPARIVVVPDVNASVSEAAGQRELEIGLPLLATFTIGQLRSVLAHELGHFAGGDTAVAARNLRRLAFLEFARERAGWLWRWFFALYAQVYALAAAPSSRAAELRADDLSVLASGPAVAAESFRAALRADAAWNHVFEEYVPLFEMAERRASLGEALRRIIEANRAAIDEQMDAFIAEQRPAATDTHPPLRERIARITQMQEPPGQVPLAADRPATDLLTGGASWLDAAEGELLAHDRPLASWDEVVDRGVRGGVDSVADQLSSAMQQDGLGDGSLLNLLLLMDDPSDGGFLARIAGTDDEARENLRLGVSNAVSSALLGADAARVEFSWNREPVLIAPGGAELPVWDRVSAALESGDGASLRSWLLECGVDVANVPVASGRGVERWLAAASHLMGPWKGRCDVHFWSTGILALPLDKKVVREDGQRVGWEGQDERLYTAAAAGVEAGRAAPGAEWWDADRITGGDMHGTIKRRIRLELADGNTAEMRSTLETAEVDSLPDVYAAVGYLVTPRPSPSTGTH